MAVGVPIATSSYQLLIYKHSRSACYLATMDFLNTHPAQHSAATRQSQAILGIAGRERELATEVGAHSADTDGIKAGADTTPRNASAGAAAFTTPGAMVEILTDISPASPPSEIANGTGEVSARTTPPTLNHIGAAMSLETTLAENTAAIIHLTAAILNSFPTTTTPAVPVVATAPKVTKDKTKPKAATEETNKALEAQLVAPDATSVVVNASTTAPVSESVDYTAVKKAITELSVVKGRDAVVALLAQYGAAKGTDLTPDQFGAFVTKANHMNGA